MGATALYSLNRKSGVDVAKIVDPKTDAQIHHGRREKLRQSFKNYGLQTFNETQVLEFALGMTMPRIDTNPLAHRLIDTFGSLDGVISAHPDKLKKVVGVGEQVACFLHFLKELVTYVMLTQKKDRKIKTPADAIAHLREVMKTYPVENFVIICLDKSGTVILREIIPGSVDKVDLNIRNIVDAVFRVQAASVVCAHNHLDENVSPSDSDMHLTRAMVNFFMPLSINFMDHIIFSGDKEYSFARSGVMDVFRREHMNFSMSREYKVGLNSSITSKYDRPSNG